ncbi:MAG: pseudouridine synthase [Bacteroidales bacterium]|nr:pseudouridine synthase [Bacteroidales bacterium]
MDEGITKNGRKLRPRKKVGSSKEIADHRNYEDQQRRAGEHRPYGENRYYGDRREGDAHRSNYGERRNYGEHRPYGERRPYGEHRSSYGEHRSYNDQHSFNSQPQPYTPGERRGFEPPRPRSERRSYEARDDQQPRYNNNYGEHRAYDNPRPYGERRSYGEGRPYGDRREGGDRRSYGAQRGPGQGYRKPAGKRPAANKGKKPIFGKAADAGISRMISRKPVPEYSDNDNVMIPVKEEIRLNRFIANSGVCSRREADTYIQAGVVTVNGEVVTELGTKINVYTDDVRFNGERLKGEEKVYIVMNKPKGYVTTTSDPHAEKTVIDLLKGCDARVFPVGRLDKATTGVLMFTNDGEIAERLTHPSYDKKKIYQVLLDHELTQEDHDKILAGVELNDGPVAADELEFIEDGDHRKLGIEIHSGKNRIVRRIFESLGYSVRALDRVYFAGLTKKGLKKGEWRFLTEGEVNILKMGAYV